MKIWFDSSITEYDSDEGCNANNPLEIKRVNFFVGANNAGKSRFIRLLLVLIFNTVHEKNQVSITVFLEFINFIKHHLGENHYEELTCQYIDSFKSIKSNPKRFCETMKDIIQDFENNTYSFVTSNLEVYQQLRSKLNDIFFQDSVLEFKREINHVKYPEYMLGYYVPSLRTLKKMANEHNIDESTIKEITTYFDTKSIYSYEKDRDVKDIQSYKYILHRKTFEDYNFYLEHILTGEEMFEEFTTVTLGNDEQISNFENFKKQLSKYFFNGENIRIVPNKEDKAIQIKIGSQPQFPITELGDGLQQIIILSYKAFLTTNPICFCIEEPEMHLHAGYQRQLIKFLLNETPHYYFFTTHSNHFLDMTTEDERIALYRIDKQEIQKDGETKFQKTVRRCDQDNDILSVLGVRPSSVFLANCTIWVEGITDRLYLSAYMKKYLQEIKASNPEKYAEYSKYIDGYHYAFVEYQGSNLAHWSFDDVENVDTEDDNGLKAKAISSSALLIADGDVNDKDRMNAIREQLNMNCVELVCKETENTLPKTILEEVFFKWLPKSGKKRGKAKFNDTQRESFDFNLTDAYLTDDKGIGFHLNQVVVNHFTEIEVDNIYTFSEGGQGTIKDKTKFCRDAISYMNKEEFNWALTDQAKELCEIIFQHISTHNSDKPHTDDENGEDIQ